MSTSSSRSAIERLQKEKARLEHDLANERQRASRVHGDIASLTRSVTSFTSVSMLRVKQQQITGKQQDLARIQKKIADIEAKKASNLSQLNRELDNLSRVEAEERRRLDAAEKSRRAEDLKTSRQITREMERQSQLHNTLSRSPLVIDLAKLPEKINILFLASDPDPAPGNQPLRLNEEVRLITERIRASDYRDSIKFISRWAVRSSDILQALNEHRPHIVHFSGHGDVDGIVLRNADGSPNLVPRGAIAFAMNAALEDIRLVIFNSCFSSKQAEEVVQYVEAAIGMNDALGDDAARVFAGQFYSAIGFGLSVQQAFDQARAELMLEGIPEDQTPELYCRPGVEPSELVLVRPRVGDRRVMRARGGPVNFIGTLQAGDNGGGDDGVAGGDGYDGADGGPVNIGPGTFIQAGDGGSDGPGGNVWIKGGDAKP